MGSSNLLINSDVIAYRFEFRVRNRAPEFLSSCAEPTMQRPPNYLRYIVKQVFKSMEKQRARRVSSLAPWMHSLKEVSVLHLPFLAESLNVLDDLHNALQVKLTLNQSIYATSFPG